VTVRWVGADEIRSRLSPIEAIEAVADALAAQVAGGASAGMRVIEPGPGLELALMPGQVGSVLGLKAITISESNPKVGLPTIQGAVVVFNADSGALLGVVDGAGLTGLRTAAIAGYATRMLASEAASTLLVAGAGAQAPYQIEAALAVRPIRQLLLWNRTRSRAEALAVATGELHPELQIEVVADIRRAASRADVITLATAAEMPLLFAEDLRSPSHINAMGAYRPDRREVDASVVTAATVYADTIAGCLAEAGDLMIPISQGLLTAAEIRPLATAKRAPGQGITLMKSVGSAIFDLACAARLLDTGDGSGRPAA
jgi:alanine dehydrogenase